MLYHDEAVAMACDNICNSVLQPPRKKTKVSSSPVGSDRGPNGSRSFLEVHDSET